MTPSCSPSICCPLPRAVLRHAWKGHAQAAHRAAVAPDATAARGTKRVMAAVGDAGCGLVAAVALHFVAEQPRPGLSIPIAFAVTVID